MRFYRFLLHLYPSAFRFEYGDEMASLFVKRRRDVSNIFSLFLLWIQTFFDILVNAVRVHWDILMQDLRYAVRTLTRTPGFAITVILIAGLGIGATTAVFTVADYVLIRPLPFKDSDRLVRIWEAPPGYSELELSPLNYRDWKNMSTSFENMGAFHQISVNLVGRGQPERLEGVTVTSDVFPVLGAKPFLGRVFTKAEDSEKAGGTVMLSYGLWQSSFGGNPNVIGSVVHLDDKPYLIIGVMPQEFYFPTQKPRLWTSFQLGPDDFQDRADNYLEVVARVKPGVTIENARQELKVIAGQLEKEYPKENEKTSANVIRMQDEISKRSRMLLKGLLGAAMCVLLIVCANLANLLLARSMARKKELAVRASLGAGKERMVRQLLTESLLLSLTGGVLGVLAAKIALPLLIRLVPQTLPIGDPTLDLRVMLFAFGVTLITALGFGLIPSLRAIADTDSNGLREGSRGGVGGHRERFRSGLVIVEVSISVILLVSAGLMIRALWRIQMIDPGFRTENVLAVRTALPMPKYKTVMSRFQFYDRVLSGAQQLPGVSSAAYITQLPMDLTGGIWPVIVPGNPIYRSADNTASLRFITPGFFQTLSIPFRAGRNINRLDTGDSQFVAVVSESFVRRYWPGQDPIGRQFKFALHDRTVVGVVGDIKVRGLERTSEPQVYIPYQQVDDNEVIWYSPKDMVIRSTMEQGALVSALRTIIHEADPEQPISDIRTLEEIVTADTSARRTQVMTLASFAALAVILAGIGIHGLLSFSVTQRTQEIGVRMALGAQPADIMKMVLREGAILAVAGVVIGAGVAYMAGRVMEALLAGLRPQDAATFLTAITVSIIMTILGSIFPALRAIHVDPATTIRVE